MNMSSRVNHLEIIDIQLIKANAIFFALIIAKLAPQILEVSIWWFIGLLLIFGIKPTYAFFSFLNSSEKWFSLTDLKLLQASAMCFIFFIVKLIPGLMEINIWWFVGLFFITWIRPAYAFWFK